MSISIVMKKGGTNESQQEKDKCVMFKVDLRTTLGDVSFKSILARSVVSLLAESSTIIDYTITDNSTNEEVALEYVECMSVWKEK